MDPSQAMNVDVYDNDDEDSGHRRRRPLYRHPSNSTFDPTNTNALPRTSSLFSPKMTLRGRDYDSAIADSPVRHAIFNKPFTTLRRRTEILLDSITGGTLPPEVKETERRRKEADRQLKCRGCKVMFGDERGLTRHLNLFPAHVNPPEHVPSTASRKKMRTPHRSQSASDALNAVPNSRPRPRSRPQPTHTRSDTEVVHPPAKTASDFYQPISPALHAATTVYSADPTPALSHPTAPSESSSIQQPASVLAAPLPDPPFPSLPSTSSSPPALLPAFDFAAFQTISQVGGIEPPRKPLPPQQVGGSPLIAYGERNEAAGAASAAKFHSLHKERARRTISESALDKMTMPNSLGGVVRAVVATASTGPDGIAVLPAQAPSLSRNLGPAYLVLGDQEGDEAVADDKSPVSSTLPRNWSGLLNPLPGASSIEKKERNAKEIEPIKTGLTSFSTVDTTIPISSASTPNLRRLLPRRSTNPFLNEAFMSNLSLSRTPPLSPSPTSPFARSSSPGNPFARLYAEEEGGDQEDNFYDAPDSPTAEYGRAIPSSTVSKNPFYESPDQRNFIVSSAYSNRDNVQSTGLGLMKDSARGSNTPSPQNVPRGIRSDSRAAIKSNENPRCPSCRQNFTDLEAILHHLDDSDCDPYDTSDPRGVLAM